jgi:hypothetical protein
MERIEVILLAIYLIIVAVLSICFAVMTLHLPPRPVCKTPELRPDLTIDQCRRRLW